MFMPSILLEELSGNTINSSDNMTSNVSIAYNASDSQQRNAILQAQTKISKAQTRKEEKDKRKASFGFGPKTEFTSIFLDD